MSDAFGAYVRSQRQLARLTLRQAAEMASISNPYLSQIEHGLSLPSIAVIRALADALSVSAETLLLRAAGIASPATGERANLTEEAIRQDSRLDDGQKQALLAVLASFVRSSPRVAPAESGEPAASPPWAAPGPALDPGSTTQAGPTDIRHASSKRTSGRPATAGAVSTRRLRNAHD